MNKRNGLLLLALYALFYSGTNLFYHVHVVNGIQIVHSHFHPIETENKESKRHSHSLPELQTLHFLSNVASEEIGYSENIGTPVFTVVLLLLEDHNFAHKTLSSFVTHLFRAPPALLSHNINS